MAKAVQLPKSRRLWRYHVKIDTEGGDRVWSPSELLPLEEARREADFYLVRGFEVRMQEDAKAVEEYWLEREKAAELRKATK